MRNDSFKSEKRLQNKEVERFDLSASSLRAEN